MTWRLIVTDTYDLGNGRSQTSGVLTNDVEKLEFVGQHRGLPALAAQARSFVAAHEAVAATKDDVFKGLEVDLTPPAPKEPEPPTKEEQDRQAFFADLYAYRQQQKLDALPADLKARCLPEYVGAL